MKSSFDLKHDLGKITPENDDDLWILDSILQKGDFVTAKTLRSVQVQRGDEKIKVGKKPVILTIELDKKELTPDSLRLSGKIIEGPEDIEKKSHTIDASIQTFLKIQRKWHSWEIQKIKDAEQRVEPVLVLILDDSEADFYQVRQKVKHLVHIRGRSYGKEQGKSEKPEYFKELLSYLGRREEKYLVIAGPGFAREDLQKILPKNFEKTVFTDSCSHTGIVGIKEILNRKVLEKVVKSSRVSQESELVEKLFEEIAKDGKVVYGLSQTQSALEQGAIELLLISDKLVRKNESLLETAEELKTKIMIISSDHEQGERFSEFSGIAGFLRYKI